MIVRAKHWIKVGEDNWVEGGEEFEIDSESISLLSDLVDIVDSGNEPNAEPAKPNDGNKADDRSQATPPSDPGSKPKRTRKKTN